jgi:hypothetical protein
VTYEGDAFISYAHLDNLELSEGHKGWVANLHRALETKVSQLLGRRSRIWRDPKLAGNDVLSDTLIEQLRKVAALVSVLSPGYVRSEWGRRELAEFCKACEEQGGLLIQDKARIFKVLKTPVPRQLLPPELEAVLGYEFFKVDPETGRARELDEIFGPEAERDFWLKLDDLAHDVCGLIQLIDASSVDVPPVVVEHGTVFLAETTSDLREQRDAIKRDLQQHGYTVLPARSLPLSVEEAAAAIREDLALCRMSIHMIGRHYGLVHEGAVESVIELQNELAIERGPAAELFERLIWIPRGLKVTDERQQRLIEQLRMDPRVHDKADLLETSLEDLKTAIAIRLKRDGKPRPHTVVSSPAAHVYLLYDSRDTDVVGPWADFLFSDFEVIHPAFNCDEAELRQYHEENLRTCDGVMIFYGAGNEPWLRRKLSELQKSAGYGRTKAMPEVVICLIPPRTAEKVRFRTHRALVVPQWEGLSPDALKPFVSVLKARGEERQGDGAGDPV